MQPAKQDFAPMHITKIELENIKSHIETSFDFTAGTTAITGENGAGKTTLIEAIAWTLFDLLEYKKDEFLRRGTKKGVVRVSFISGLDEREYTVYRDTGTGYYVYDPRLKTRIAEKKDEVVRFLIKHLGVEPGSDLSTLFRQAIGVPQGTFTAIFLASAAERKRTFDTLLKVEEYRRGADELLKTQRYVETQIFAIRENIARGEGELKNVESFDADYQNTKSEREKLAASFETLNDEVVTKVALVAKFDQIAERTEKARQDSERLNGEIARAELLLEQKAKETEASLAALAIIKSVADENQLHIRAVERLQELERERSKRDAFRQQLSSVESAIVNINADARRFQEKLAGILKAHQTLEQLRPMVGEQDDIDRKLSQARNNLAVANAAAGQIKQLSEAVVRLRLEYHANQERIKSVVEQSKMAADVDNLQKQERDIVNELARAKAALERDQAFQREIQNGLCPILSQKCLNLKAGETLEGYISSQFSELKQQIAQSETEQAEVAKKLQNAREAAKLAATLANLHERSAEITNEGKKLKEEQAAIEGEIENPETIEIEVKSLERRLAEIDNPRGKITTLDAEIATEFETRENITATEKQLENLISEKQILLEQLEAYINLDEQWQEFSGVRDKTLTSHRAFFSNENIAGFYAERLAEQEKATEQLAALKEKAKDFGSVLAELSAEYDRDLHLAGKSAMIDSERRKAETGARLEAAKKREQELAAEIERLAVTRKALQTEYREKERLEKVGDATVFIRETLKEAAPRVARNYVFHVSAEANQMYREITGNPERTLKWNEDYGISLEEGGYERPFVSLSGGEQMAAALSVRLSLLKQISDIRIAFFDEPTTNMDAERRENLAMQISRIKHFDQMFVISHDDTFEGYMDSELKIGD